MENISKAATTIGIISFSFQFTYHLNYLESSSETKEEINSNFGALISSIAALSNVLHILETQPRNPMVPLPAELETSTQECVSGLSEVEALLRLQQVKSESLIRSKMELKQEDIEKIQGILQTQIGVLKPYTSSYFYTTDSKRLEETSDVPGGMIQGAELDISTHTYRTFHESIITTIGFQCLDYYSNENIEDTHVLHSNMEPSSNLKVIIQQLIEGKTTYSRRQLYELLSLLKVLYDFKPTRDSAMPRSQWWPTILACLRRLSNLSGMLSTESPSVEAHEALVALKLHAIMVRRSITGGTHDQKGFQGQHSSHAGVISENEESRRLTVRLTVGPSIRGNTIRRFSDRIRKTPRKRLATMAARRSALAKVLENSLYADTSVYGKGVGSGTIGGTRTDKQTDS